MLFLGEIMGLYINKTQFEGNTSEGVRETRQGGECDRAANPIRSRKKERSRWGSPWWYPSWRHE